MEDYFKQLPKKEKEKLKLLATVIIYKINKTFKKNRLTTSGNEDILEKIIKYGYREVNECMSIAFRKYHYLSDDEVISKFGGIIYNRNEKKLLVKI